VSGTDELVTISEVEPKLGDTAGALATGSPGAQATPQSSTNHPPTKKPQVSLQPDALVTARAGKEGEPSVLTTHGRALGRYKELVAGAVGRTVAALGRVVNLLKIGSLKRGIQSLGTSVIDAHLRGLQRIRGGAADSTADNDAKEEVRRGNSREQVVKEIRGRAKEVLAPPAKLPTSRVRVALIILLFTIIGGVSGMLFSFALFSTMVTKQAMRIDEQIDEMVLLGRQYEKAKTASAQLRNSNQDLLRRLEEAEQALAKLDSSRSTAMTPAPEARQTEWRIPPSPRRSPGSHSEGARSRDCVVGKDDISGDLSKCIRELDGG